MSMNTFDAFGPLDDLIQVIYQGTHRFVLLSRVDFDSLAPGWLVYIGLTDEGRWWRGRWEEADIDAFVGKNVSSDLLEAFADNIAKRVTSGELFVEGMDNSEPRAGETDMKIVFGPHESRPLKIPLKALEREETIVFLTNEFFELGLNAQKRKCKLNPPAFQPATATAPHQRPRNDEERERHRRRSPESSPAPASKKSRKTSISPPRASSIRHTKISPPLRTFKEKEKSPAPAETPAPAAAPTKPKSKIGPTKKARKVQKMEFASDDE